MGNKLEYLYLRVAHSAGINNRVAQVLRQRKDGPRGVGTTPSLACFETLKIPESKFE